MSWQRYGSGLGFTILVIAMRKHTYLILFLVLYVSRTRSFSPDIITTSKQAMLTNDVINLSLPLIKTEEVELATLPSLFN